MQRVPLPAVQTSSDKAALSTFIHLHSDSNRQVSGIQFLATEFFRNALSVIAASHESISSRSAIAFAKGDDCRRCDASKAMASMEKWSATLS